jgi:subtilase family serine protease
VRNPKRSLVVPVLQWLSGTVLAGVLLCAATAQAGQHAALTSHVPVAVASGQVSRVGKLPGTQRMNAAISLPPRNEAELDDLLQQLYDPQSPSYHQYLSVQEFTERFGPTQGDRDEVVRFAERHGLQVTEAHANRMVVDVEGSVANVEKAFHVTMGVYRHPTENRRFFAPDREPTLDSDIPVLHISGLDNFSPPRAKFTNSSRGPGVIGELTGSGPGGNFIGSDTRAAYYGSGSLTGAGQSVGMFEIKGYELSDVQLYFQTVHQPLNVPINGVSLNGVSLDCLPPRCDDSEAALDIEMAISMAPGLSQVVVYVGSNPVSIFSRMASDNTSKQLTCTSGFPDDESSLDPIFKEYAAQGQTLFVATGDQGSSTPPNVVWPADDPWVTAVGGTDLVTNGAGGSWRSETGWKGSAGGPSGNNVPIPTYQKLPGVVNSSNQASPTLRNYPDVAAEANSNIYSCFNGACSGGHGGTSYAAPQWAGFMALVNQQAIANGGAPLGFLNPTFYQIGIRSNYHSDFHDITSGSNGGYSAVTGYDLVTGWGSLNGPNLLNALLGSK